MDKLYYKGNIMSAFILHNLSMNENMKSKINT
jgi:hypothetical protein